MNKDKAKKKRFMKYRWLPAVNASVRWGGGTIAS